MYGINASERQLRSKKKKLSIIAVCRGTETRGDKKGLKKVGN